MAEELKVLLDAESNLGEVFTKDGIDAKALKTQLHGLAEDALGALIDFSKEGVAATLDLAEQQRDLATVTGTSAHEAGVLIQALDDAGVSSDALTTAAKKLSAEGLSLNADNLRDLRTQYQSITDPVDRAQFATENFGRAAGPEMQKALNLSNQAFEELIEGAEGSALALGDDAVQAARDYEIAQDNMADAIQSAQVIIGQELIPVLTDLANFASENLVPAISAAAEVWNTAKTSAEQLSFILEYQATQLELVYSKQELTNAQIAQAAPITNMYGVELENLNTGLTEGEALTRLQASAWQDSTLTAQQLTQATIDATAGLDAHERAALAAATSTDVLTASTYGNITATDLLDASMQKYSATVLFKNAAENLSTEAAIALGVEMGVLDSKTLLATQAVDELKAKYDSNRDGAIDATEAAAGYTQAIIDLHNNLEALPETTTTNVVTNFITTGGSQSVGGQGSSVGGSSAIGFAEGGISSGPSSGYLATLHGTEAIIPLDGGNVPVELRAPANSGMGGGVTNIYFSYSPMLSLGDRVELETVVKPMFERLGFVVR